MSTLEIKLTNESYLVYIEKNIFSKLGQFLGKHFDFQKIAIITDNNLEKLYGAELVNNLKELGREVRLISVEPGETSKSFDRLMQVYQALSEYKIGRQDLLVTFGGGVVGDLGGFAAATYLRGVPYIQVPTSLLAQVDSSIGGKVAVDLPWGKNLVGSFYHPEAVFIDPELLKTLDKRFLHDGLAEVIKYGCIKENALISQLMSYKSDEELLEHIEPVLLECCSIKKSVVEQDEKDHGERMLLNFGHTLGHAIEKYYSYSRFTHGEAVAIGMNIITRKSEQQGITQKGTATAIEQVLQRYDLPYELPEMDMEEIYKIIELDKKSGNESIKLILLKKLGESFIQNVNLKEIYYFI